MDLHDFKYKVREITDRFRGDNPARTKLIIVGSVAGIVFLFFLIQFVPLLIPARTARELDTAGWRIARTLNTSLAADPDFADAGFTVESESPLKFKVVGAVHTQAALEKLLATLKDLRPQEDFTVEVEILVPDK